MIGEDIDDDIEEEYNRKLQEEIDRLEQQEYVFEHVSPNDIDSDDSAVDMELLRVMPSMIQKNKYNEDTYDISVRTSSSEMMDKLSFILQYKHDHNDSYNTSAADKRLKLARYATIRNAVHNGCIHVSEVQHFKLIGGMIAFRINNISASDIRDIYKHLVDIL